VCVCACVCVCVCVCVCSYGWRELMTMSGYTVTHRCPLGTGYDTSLD